MSSMCPVCNGFQQLEAKCPECGGKADDDGRLNDFLGPYSPYRPIDDIGMDNGVLDVGLHRCTHVTHCASCGYTFHSFVEEWRS